MMAVMGGFSASDLKRLQKRLNEIRDGDVEAFIDECAKELAARLLALVIKRTLPGDYSKEVEVVAKRDSKNHKKGDTYTKKVNPSGKVGGTLRRGWTSSTHADAANGTGKGDAKAYAESLTVNHFGGMVVIEIINPVEYASYVEYGHRTRNHKGWVIGKFMMTISVKEIQNIAPNLLESKIKKFLGECMK
jgi:hypothetical protein|nr:MAG TPA: type I neck protein [Caudoviricetes sp.]